MNSVGLIAAGFQARTGGDNLFDGYRANADSLMLLFNLAGYFRFSRMRADKAACPPHAQYQAEHKYDKDQIKQCQPRQRLFA